MRKIKVLQCTIAESAGGRTQFLLNLWEKIDKTKYEFDFLTFSRSISYAKCIEDTGARIWYMHTYPEKNEHEFRREFKEILNNGYDVIHIATSYWKNTIIEQMAKEAGIKKIIIHSHSAGLESKTGNYEDELKRHYKIKETISENLATDFLACSVSSAEWLYGSTISKDKITVIHNGIDTKRFAYCEQKRKQLRYDTGLDNKYVIGFLGRLQQVKNIEYIIDLFEKIYQTNKETFLLIVGDGLLREKLEEKMRNTFPSEVYCFAGKVKNTEDYLLEMDVLLLPSLFEGFPITLVEAQCTGLKCLVSTNVSEEVVVTELIERIPLDKKEIWLDRIRMIALGYKRESQEIAIKEHYLDMDSVARQIEKIYEDV